MRQTQNISGFVHSQAYVKAIACLVLACGGTLPTLAASETLSNPKVEEAQQSEITVRVQLLMMPVSQSSELPLWKRNP